MTCFFATMLSNKEQHKPASTDSNQLGSKQDVSQKSGDAKGEEKSKAQLLRLKQKEDAASMQLSRWKFEQLLGTEKCTRGKRKGRKRKAEHGKPAADSSHGQGKKCSFCGISDTRQ